LTPDPAGAVLRSFFSLLPIEASNKHGKGILLKIPRQTVLSEIFCSCSDLVGKEVIEVKIVGHNVLALKFNS
jgi:predicted nucleic acid-binding Zn finger protein